MVFPNHTCRYKSTGDDVRSELEGLASWAEVEESKTPDDDRYLSSDNEYIDDQGSDGKLSRSDSGSDGEDHTSDDEAED